MNNILSKNISKQFTESIVIFQGYKKYKGVGMESEVRQLSW